MKKICILGLCLGCSLYSASALEIIVSPKGDDSNNGTKESPVQTIRAAQSLAQKAYKQNSKEVVEIVLSEGDYYQEKGLVFDRQLSGTKDNPLIIRAQKGKRASLSGSRTIEVKAWKPLSKTAAKRVHPGVDPKKIYEIDLEALGIQNIQPFPDSFTLTWSSIDFFADGERMPISQFPNPSERITPKNEKGWATCNGSKDERSFFYAEGGQPKDGDTTNELDADGSKRSERWARSIKEGHDLWLKGNFRVPWDPVTLRVEEVNTREKYIRFAVQPGGGMGSKYSSEVAGSNPIYRVGTGEETYFAINYLDEIDQPGEWALDFKDKKLYFYPKGDIKKSICRISDNKQPLIAFNGAQHVRIEQLVLDGNLGNGIDIQRSSDIAVVGCELKNISATGIQINQSERIEILSNDLYHIGSFGINLQKCGNLFKIQSAEIRLDNNHIHHMGEMAFNGGIALMECVGVTIRHNLIHDSPKNAIENRNSINITMEYNEMHNVALRTGDTGAVYSYGGWYTYGNILRYNFVHHVVRCNGLYPDDGDSGDIMYGNIIQGANNGFHVGGGHDNLMYNNLVVDCERINIDDRGKNRNYKLGTNYEKNLTRYNIDAEPWLGFGQRLIKEYPIKTKLWNEILSPDYHPELPQNCILKNNVFVKVGRKTIAKGDAVEVADNLEIATIEEAGFFDYAQMDLRSKNPALLAKYPDLNEQFPKIGLYKDAFRLYLPTRKEHGGLVNRIGKEGDKEDQLIFQK